MPGYYIKRYEERDSDTHNFVVKDKEVAMEGHLYSILYLKQREGKEASRIQILRDYENASELLIRTVPPIFLIVSRVID
jgi:hypothetical protein